MSDKKKGFLTEIPSGFLDPEIRWLFEEYKKVYSPSNREKNQSIRENKEGVRRSVNTWVLAVVLRGCYFFFGREANTLTKLVKQPLIRSKIRGNGEVSMLVYEGTFESLIDLVVGSKYRIATIDIGSRMPQLV